MKLDFIIVGVMKCGTTTLGHYLYEHPEVAIPDWEVAFFNTPERFAKGYGYYEDYVAKFSSPETKISGEKTPYSYEPNSAFEIHKYNPEIKLIWIFRNPTDRAWSNYTHDLWHMDEHKSFEKCLKDENNRELLFQYISKGQYIDQVKEYLKYFDKSQMHFIVLEEFVKNKKLMLIDLFDFLGIGHGGYDFEQKIHSKKSYQPKYNPMYLHLLKKVIGTKNRVWNWFWNLNFKDKTKQSMKPKTRAWLDNYYLPYNNELSELIGKDLSIWNKKS